MEIPWQAPSGVSAVLSLKGEILCSHRMSSGLSPRGSHKIYQGLAAITHKISLSSDCNLDAHLPKELYYQVFPL